MAEVIETIARGVCVRDGKVLLCKSKTAANSYLPGGHIEFGEKAVEALVREIKEETGLDSRAGKFLGVNESSFVQNGERHCEINLVYELELASPEAEVVSAEDWIEFWWCDLGRIGEATVLPADIKRFIPRPE